MYLDGRIRIRDYAFFWSATESDNSVAWYRSLDYNYGSVYRYYYVYGSNKSSGASIRCLRD
jgi:uncharacterized protein (TIGR02145 family)